MDKYLKGTISFLFQALLFLVPLVLWPNTSELFEFNKMLLTYTLTTIIVSLWISRMVIRKEFIFKRSVLDIPLLLFFISQLLSTLLSIDQRTSLFGYYSRFHGGLFSTISYLLLYWAFVSNLGKKDVKKSTVSILVSSLLVSIYGILQHFGIDKNVWVQDVQNRIFSTLGQPNWLAAFLVAVIPITWAYQESKAKLKFIPFWTYPSLFAIFYLTLLYTKSRSGLLAFAISFFSFWGIYLFLKRDTLLKSAKKALVIPVSIIAIITLLIGTPWSPSLNEITKKQDISKRPQSEGPALERGGTESGEIRKIVWSGALDIWKNYPILGTGVETFAYSYYNFRPVEHNLVSEWNFLYNKAHNEYLNIATTTGTFGLLTYLGVIGAAIFIFTKKIFKKGKDRIFNSALLSGYLGILITNFFGFSVVPVAILFFILPALSVSGEKEGKVSENEKLTNPQKLALLVISAILLYILMGITNYLRADLLFARGRLLNDSGNPVNARQTLQKATNLSPKEALYWDELSEASADIAVLLFDEGEEERAGEFAQQAIEESKRAVDLSSRNVNLKRSRASMFIKLSAINPEYLLNAKQAILEAIALAPTDAKLFYNLGLTDARVGNTEDAIEELRHTVDIKSNYKEARLALALLLADKGEEEEAIEHLEYILKNIDPNDSIVKEELERLQN